MSSKRIFLFISFALKKALLTDSRLVPEQCALTNGVQNLFSAFNQKEFMPVRQSVMKMCVLSAEGQAFQREQRQFGGRSSALSVTHCKCQPIGAEE